MASHLENDQFEKVKKHILGLKPGSESKLNLKIGFQTTNFIYPENLGLFERNRET